MVTLTLGLLCALSAPSDCELVAYVRAQSEPCRAMAPIFSRLRADGLSVSVRDADKESDNALRQKVKTIPTILLIKQGKELARWEGTGTYDRLSQWLSSQSREADSNAAGRRMGAKPAEQKDSVRNPYNRSSENGRSDFGREQEIPAVIANALAATVRIKIKDPNGSSFGSGTIIDLQGSEALVVTCGHIFRDSKGAGEITVDVFQADGRFTTVAGEMLMYDLSRDIGLLTIIPPKDFTKGQVAPSSMTYSAGQVVYSIGCDRGSTPHIYASRITAVDRYKGPSNISAEGEPQTGRSGGGLFNAEGFLIGICNLANPADHEGIYAGLTTVHWQLEQAGLERVFAEPNSAQVADQRGQNEANRGSGRFENAPIEQLNAQSPDVEEFDAIVILLPKRDPGASNRVLKLKQIDPRLLDQLQSLAESQ